MAASEDDLAKKQVQEAVWAWAGRVIVLAVTFGFGFFAAWVLWGAGVEGAPALRAKTVQQDGTILELKNKRVDLDGKITVLEGRLQQCDKNLADLRAKASATP
jgi:hypothetical protein